MRFGSCFILGFTAVICAFCTQVSAGTVTSDGKDIVIKTKGGLEVRTVDNEFTFKIGGRIQAQYDSYQDAMNLIKGEGDTGSNLFIRRARLYVKGDVYRDWAYKIQFNVADSGSGGGTFEDLYIRWKRYSLATITVGKFYEPFSLQQQTSSKWVTSIERSANTTFFAEGRNLGLALRGDDDFGGYEVGVFSNRNQQNTDGAQLWAFTGRGYLSPINSERTLLHIAIAATDRDQNKSQTPITGGRLTQGIKSGDEVQVEATSALKHRQALNLEAAGKIGSLHGQFEYNFRKTELAGDGKDINNTGWYVQGGWFITGESRPYKRGKWEKIKPNRKGGLGAWELFARLEGFDFDDDNVNANNRNKGNLYIVGVNWYPNEIIRISANYVQSSWDEALAAQEQDGKKFLVRADSIPDFTGPSDDTGSGFAIRMQAAF